MKVPKILWRSGVVPLAVVTLGFFCLEPRALAESPRDDFAKWYARWVDRVPGTYEHTYTEFFGEKKDNPLIMTISRWVEPPYVLCAVTNSKKEQEFRFIENADYCASIASALKVGSSWSVSDFVGRHDSRYPERSAKLARSFGGEPKFLGSGEIFERPHSVKASESGDEGARTAIVVFSFSKDSSSKPRDPTELTVSLDESVGWMPTEIREAEVGGITTRTVLDGWHRAGDTWLYTHVSAFIQMTSSDEESLHSTRQWDFAPEDSASNRQDECFLSYYDLAEPAQPRSPWWIIVPCLVSVLLLVVGYLVLRRRDLARRRD